MSLISFLSRLEERGFIHSEKKGKERYYYVDAVREEYVRNITIDFINRYHTGSFVKMLDLIYGKDSLSSKELDDLVKEIRANADKPAKWADVMSQIGRLKFLLAQKQSGKAAFIWQAPVWGNNFQPDINPRPLKKITIKRMGIKKMLNMTIEMIMSRILLDKRYIGELDSLINFVFFRL